MAITLTTRAALELKELMENSQRRDAALRVWVAGRGCSGLSYGMAFDDDAPDPEDQIFEQDGVRIVVDPMSLQYIVGSVVDYVDTPDGEGGFKVENPNAVESCGCGSSFRTADSEAGGGACGSCASRG